MPKPKITAIEKSVKRTLFFRRLYGGIFALLLLSLLGSLWLFWTKHVHRKEHADVANYDLLDKSSPTYWTDRANQDIADIRRLGLAPEQETSRLRIRLRRTLAAAAEIQAGFTRSVAVSDAALTVFRHDVPVNVDEFLEAMGETPLATAMRARIYVSEALMHLRLRNQVAAAVALSNYDRMFTQFDVKLDTEHAELAFIGAVKIHRHTFANEALNALFRRNMRETPRILDADLQMKAYRIIATEQAHAEKDRDAMETVAHIKSRLELVRAFQAIIINVARPSKPDLAEPEVFRPQITGPWEPINGAAAKRIINDVLQVIASRDTDEQIDLLRRLAGSAMVCDPDLHTLLSSCLIESRAFDENIVSSVLQLLNDPESATIRKARNQPPLTEKQDADSALDDFAAPTDAVRANVVKTDPAIVRGIVDLERIRIQLPIARSYLAVNRHLDAARCLQEAFRIAQTLSNAKNRIDLLTDIAGLQISAGDFPGSRETFKAIGLPQRDGNGTAWDIGESMETSLSRLARLKVSARSLGDAESTIDLLPSGSAKDEEYAFLATELIRVQRLTEAARVVGKMREGSLRTAFAHRLAIAKGGKEENYLALGLPFPEKTQQDRELEGAVLALIQLGLHDAARDTASRIANSEHQSAWLLRVVRSLAPSIGPYGGEESGHPAIRKTLLDLALRTANAIESPKGRAEALELIVAATIPSSTEGAEQETLRSTVQQALEIAGGIPSSDLEKAGIVARLLSAKIRIHAVMNNRSDAWPLLDSGTDQSMIEEIRKQLSEATGSLNDRDSANETAIAREMVAIARVNGQIGRAQRAGQILGTVLEIAKTADDKRVCVFLCLSTVPLFRALGDDDAAKSVYFEAFGVIGNVPTDDPTGGNAGMLFGMRLRDTEIDLLVRSLLENDFINEAVLFAGRVTDATMQDRLLRIAAFLLIDREKFAEAENTAQRLSEWESGALEVKTALLRNIAFAKRQKRESERARGIINED